MCDLKIFLLALLCHITFLHVDADPHKGKHPPKGKPGQTKNPPPIINSQDVTQSCDSKVYCQGKLLDSVQRARIFSDSKTFVDLAQIHPEEITLQNFKKLQQETNSNPSKAQLKVFVRANFEDSSELDEWTPPDFKANPSFLEKVENDEVKHFAKDLVAIWPNLGRKISASVFEKPNQHSLIGVKNGFIIPGGRFKEFYYWDSYWIIEGLIISEMLDTAKGMVENLISTVQRYGFVPNGGRVYYLNRSQPPLLTQMAALYVSASKNLQWLRNNIQYLEQEMFYWLERHTENVVKNGRTYKMARYYSLSNTPRPESYYEDVVTCAVYNTEREKEHCYQSLKSGAETGWDFSSRWLFDSQGGVRTNLSHIDAQRVVPVDLNAFLARDFELLATFFRMLRQPQKAQEWRAKAITWKQSIQEVLYDDQHGIWYDYDVQLEKSRKLFYPSNFAPLWTGSYDLKNRAQYGRKAAEYFEKEGIQKFQGGIPTSLIDNGEQWDLPNAWAPLQEFVILGLWSTGDQKARQIAEQFAKRWVESNMKTFEDTHAMYEKYNAIQVGQVGGGGEYSVQTGFGWTNGVCLKFIDQFYTVGSSDRSSEGSSEEKSSEGKSKESSSKEKSSEDKSKESSSKEKSSKGKSKEKSAEKSSKGKSKEKASKENSSKESSKERSSEEND